MSKRNAAMHLPALALLLAHLPVLSTATLIEFFSQGDTACATAPTRSWVFTDLCTSYLGAYGLALTACGAGGAGPLEVSVFYSASGARPPPCGGGAYARLAAPARGQCVASAGAAAQFAGSFRLGGDGAPPTCASSAAQSAMHLAADSSGSCAAPPAAYLTAPLRSDDCVPSSVLGFYASRAAARAPGGVALQVFSGLEPGGACAAAGLLASWGALPLDGACAAAAAAAPGGGAAWVAAALPAAAFAPAPAPPPPALPGTGATLQVYFNASDCSGPSFYALAAYTGVCSAFVGLGVELAACAAGASATVRLYNDSAATPQTRAAAPPGCAAGAAVGVFEATLALGQCSELLSSPQGGRIYGRLLSARCEPTPPDAVFLAAHWLASAACATPPAGGDASAGPVWGTLEALPCAQYNWLGTGQNSTTAVDAGRGALNQTVHYSLGEAQGCGGPALYEFLNVPLDGSACVASSAAIAAGGGMRVVRPGGALPPPGTPSQPPTPSASPSPPPTPSVSASPTPSPSPPPTPPPTPPPSPTPSPTLSPGASPSRTPSNSPTPSATASGPPPSASAASAASASASQSPPQQPPPQQAQAQQAQQPAALSPGAAAGVALGVLALLAAGTGAAWWWWCGGGGSAAAAARAASKASAPELRRARAALTDEGGGGKHPVLAQEVVLSPLRRAAPS